MLPKWGDRGGGVGSIWVFVWAWALEPDEKKGSICLWAKEL